MSRRRARAAAETDDAGVLALVLPAGELSLALLPQPTADPTEARFVRRAGFAPRVAPEVLQAAVAGVSLRFGPGEGALEAKL